MKKPRTKAPHAPTVTRLTVENFMRVKAVDITPNRVGLVELHGRNAQGKSSILAAMWAALGGKASSPPKAIRDGADKATARVELGDLIAERVWRKDGSTRLEVMSKEGAVYRRPQQMLDELTSRISFDPVAFMHWDKARQAETLRDVAGVDSSEAELAVEEAYARRAEQNALVRSLEGALGAEPPEVEAVDVSALFAERDARVTAEAEIERFDLDVERWVDRVATLEGEATACDEEIVRLQDKRAAIAKRHAEAGEAVERYRKAVAEKREGLASHRTPADIESDIADAQKRQEAANARKRWQSDRERVETAQRVATELDEALATRRADLARLLEDATYPIEGLTVSRHGPEWNGHPLEQASQSEQLRISMAMAMATNPELRLVHIREGSLLDREAVATVAELATSQGFQVWIEVVDDDAEIGFVIEDGELAREPAAAPPDEDEGDPTQIEVELDAAESRREEEDA